MEHGIERGMYDRNSCRRYHQCEKEASLRIRGVDRSPYRCGYPSSLRGMWSSSDASEVKGGRDDPAHPYAGMKRQMIDDTV